VTFHMKHVSAKMLGSSLLMAMVIASGCATPTLNEARFAYYQGRYQEAASRIAEDHYTKADRVLFKMERGMIRQAAGDLEGSNRDFIEAYDEIEQMTAISVVQDTGSMIINDNVQDYSGAPFERTLLHSFTAKNHLLLNDYENAAVEARRIINSLMPDVRKDYPEDAYSRYMAGLCLGLIGDWSNAGLQYRLAQQLVPSLKIDERTGFISGFGNPPPVQQNSHELIVFVLMGRSPTGSELLNQHRPIYPVGYAEIFIDGNMAGRSYELADTVELAFTTKQKDALKETAKTVTRVAMKEAAAISIEQNNEALGALFRIIMIGLLEQPDVRRWETLPRSLQIARVPCPGNPQNIEARIRGYSGGNMRTIRLQPASAAGSRTYIAVMRDSQPVL